MIPLLLALQLLGPPALPLPVRPLLDTLCSPAFLGRGYVDSGDRRAGRWVEGRMRGMGLQPGFAGSYRQPFTHPVVVFTREPSLKIAGRAVQVGTHFIPDAGCPPVKGNFRLYSLAQAEQVAVSTPAQAARVAVWVDSAAAYQALLQRLGGRCPFGLVVLAEAKLTHTIAPMLEGTPTLHVLQSERPAGLDEAPAGLPLRLRVESRAIQAYPSYNVAGLVRGTQYPDSFLVVTAHYDHLGALGRRVYFPGANDNASGTAMLLELAAYLQAHPLPCSVLLCAMAGEEAGLRGSTYMAAHLPVPANKIRFLLNLDLLASGEQGGTLVNAPAVQPDFDLMRSLLADTLPTGWQPQIMGAIPAVPGLAPRANRPNSDHYPFTQLTEPIPAAFLFLRGPYAYYHQVEDRPEAVSLAGFEATFRLILRFLQKL